MTKRLKLFLAILLGSTAIACCAAGCSVGQPDRDELLADYNGGHVTYYANGGCFNNNTSIVVREIYYKNENVPFFDVNEDTGDINITNSGYDFAGWYLPARYEVGDHAGEIIYEYTPAGATDPVPAYPKLMEDGTPVTDSTEARPIFYIEGSDADILEKYVQVKPSQTMVTSSRLLAAKEELVVCATWKPALKFVFKLAAEDGDYECNGTIYHPGDVISTMAFGKEDTKNPGQTLSVSFGTYATFVANYADEQCEHFAQSYNRADYEGEAEIVVWSKFIKGSWEIVRNDPNKVQEMFNNLYDETKAYYIIESVDCSSISAFSFASETKATIEGNNCTLSNLNFNRPNYSFDNRANVSPVFGAIKSTAKISNVKLSNITINVTGKGNMTFYAICNSVEQGATIDNVEIDTVTATVKLSGSVSNAQDGDRSSWLFGGKGSDDAFVTAFGVTLTGTNTLTIT